MSTDLWKSLRAKNIGGSEVAALFGEQPPSFPTVYKLWHIKKGLINEDNLDDVERVQAGKHLEPSIIAWANEKWMRSYYQPQVYLQHPSVEGMGCTPDAFDGEYPVMAQIKNVDSFQFSQEWDYDGDEITEAPLHILLQVQHELDCAPDKEHADLIVCVGGNRLLAMRCERDEQVARMIREAVQDFWWRIAPPPPDFARDGDIVRQIRRRLPAAEIVDMTGDQYVHDLMAKNQLANFRAKVAQDEVEATRTELFHLVGNTARVKCGPYTMKFSSRKGSPDQKITADMVGQTIKGRAESVSATITKEGSPL